MISRKRRAESMLEAIRRRSRPIAAIVTAALALRLRRRGARLPAIQPYRVCAHVVTGRLISWFRRCRMALEARPFLRGKGKGLRDALAVNSVSMPTRSPPIECGNGSEQRAASLSLASSTSASGSGSRSTHTVISRLFLNLS